MRYVACSGDKVEGHVGHHAGHVIGTDADGLPIFCNGHAVIGTPEPTQSRLRVSGRVALTGGDSGPSTCPCDGGSVRLAIVTAPLRIGQQSVSGDGDGADFHGAGQGYLHGSSKLRLGR